jgi:surface antigen
MKRLRTFCVFAILSSLSACGCATHTGTGALGGAMLGAPAGALIGAQTGNAGEGALLGALFGTAAGGLIGAGMDENDRRNEVRHAHEMAAIQAQNTPPPMSIYDVVNLARSGVSDDVIIAQIHSTRSVFILRADDITALHHSGVSNRVIQAMIDTGSRRPPAVVRPVVYERPVIVEPAPVYVYEPPPRIHIGFGYHYCRPYCRPRRCW